MTDINITTQDILTAVVRASFESRFIQTGVDPAGNTMGYSETAAIQPIVDSITTAIRNDPSFVEAFLAAVVARVDDIARQVADQIAASVLYKQTANYGGSSSTNVASWAKPAIDACLAEAFLPAVTAHVQERLTTLDLSSMDISVTAAVKPK